jgi:hypothetical protein
MRAGRPAKDYQNSAIGRLVQVFPIEKFNQMIARVAEQLDSVRRASVTRTKAQTFLASE